MDPLTHVLQSVRLEGTVFSRAELDAPWGVSTRGVDSGLFHVVVSGRALLRCEGTRVVHPLETGDVALLPGGAAHVLCDRLVSQVRPMSGLPKERAGSLELLRVRGSGASTELLCGTFQVASGTSHPLFGELPQVVVVRHDDPAVSGWLGATVRLMADEARTQAPGHTALLSHLTSVLLVHALRGYAANTPPSAKGWLAGLRDPRIAQAFALMHSQPQAPWSAERLARAVGMSRSAFYDRFTERVGSPPLEYLARWRMHLACRALCDESVGLAELAMRLGYGSEAAFIRAFRRVVGTTPGAYRRAPPSELAPREPRAAEPRRRRASG